MLRTPCHTTNSVCYLLEYKEDPPLLFTGDTLFIAGCGMFFEGTAEEMIENMKQFKRLRKETKIYPGHEYTENNLLFSKFAEPGNKEVIEKLVKCIDYRTQNKYLIPSTIGIMEFR